MPDNWDEPEPPKKHKRRRRGGASSGALAMPRLDRRSRKPPAQSMPGGSEGSSPSIPTGIKPPMMKPPADTSSPSDDDMGSGSGPGLGGLGSAADGGLKAGGKLTAKERHALPKADFALPGGRYPINDPNHARNALARVSQHGSSEEKAKVRGAVHRKYPEIGKD